MPEVHKGTEPASVKQLSRRAMEGRNRRLCLFAPTNGVVGGSDLRVMWIFERSPSRP